MGRGPRRIQLPLPVGETMALGLALWLCCLPVVLLIAWFLGFGLRGAAIGAGLALAAILILCWGICANRALADTGPSGPTRA